MARQAAGTLQNIGLYRIFFDLSGDGLYVLDRDSDKYLIVNPAFCTMLGHPPADFLDGTVKPIDLVVKEDWPIVVRMDDPKNAVDFDRIEVGLITKSGKVIDGEISIHNVVLQGRRLRLGSVRNISEHKKLRAQLKEKLVLERNAALETAKANIRIGQLCDKIGTVPRLATELLDARDEATLLERAANYLRDPQGMNYHEVTLYIANAKRLNLAFSTDAAARKTISINNRTRLGRIAHEAVSVFDEKRHEEIVPLKAHDLFIGLIIAKSSPDERILFDGGATVKRGQHEVLVTLGNILGLAVQNLRLFHQIEQQSIIDQLTGVFNRRHFDRKLQDEFLRAKRYKRNMSLIVIDLDLFKNINDNYGHQQGDVVLKGVADFLNARSREVDIICRYGGDEFVILLPETGPEEAQKKAENLMKQIHRKRFPNTASPRKPFSITLSMGISDIMSCKDEIELFRKADEALYESKKKGRDRVTVSSKNGAKG
ncbi:MAG: sensor domain-containing diguanylate cyclase [Planctomycetota bacterium]